jgi:hypothetical protein
MELANMTVLWRRIVHGLSVTTLFLVLSACLVWVFYAAVILYGLSAYIAIAAIVLFVWVWTWCHTDETHGQLTMSAF